MEQIYSYTIKLIRYVLNGDVPELPENIDFEKLFAFGRSHGVENMLYVGLRDLKINVPTEIMKQFRTAYEIQIMVEATQALEYESLCEIFEEADVDFLPLKGIVIRNLYPMPDYRKSGDIDILVRPEDRKRIKELMTANGYVVDEFDEMEIHDGYRKPPHILIEVHNRLVEKSNRAYNYYSKIWNEVRLKAGTKHCYEMSKECFYAFIIAHLCKHIKNEGAGIKFICDIWVLNKVYGNSFDRKELTKILNVANITEFEAMAREIAEYWFSDRDEVSDDVLALEKFVLESGCFGTKENYKKIRASIAADDAGELAKYRYKRFMSNVFVPYSKLKKNYPILKKCCLLLPFIWILRLFRILCDGSKSIGDRLNATFTIDAEESGKLKNLWNAVN